MIKPLRLSAILLIAGCCWIAKIQAKEEIFAIPTTKFDAQKTKSQEAVTIIANGHFDGDENLLERYKDSYIIAVDGGLNYCYKAKVIPDKIVGDLDSVNRKILEKFTHVETLLLPHDKDVTDLEAALNLVDFSKTKKVILLAALGGRIDHCLGNLVLLTRFPGKVFIETEKELVFAVNGTTGKTNMPCFQGQTISLVPLNGPASGIQTEGLKWELKNGTLDKNFIGISNECLQDTFSLSLEKGDLLCIINKGEVNSSQ